MVRRFNVAIPLREGITLAADLALPPRLPAPAVVLRTPYGRSGAPQSKRAAGFARAGYVSVLADVRAIEKAGRHPIVLASTAAELSQLGNGAVNLVMAQDTSIDEHVIFGTPRNTLPQRFTVYSWEPAK